MANNGSKITSKQVSIEDVKTVLGETTNNLKALCVSSKINKWARYKPVHHKGNVLESNPEGENSYTINGVDYKGFKGMAHRLSSGFNKTLEEIVAKNYTLIPVTHYRLHDFFIKSIKCNRVL